MYSKNPSKSPDSNENSAEMIFVTNSTTFVIAAMIGAAAFIIPFMIAMIRVRINSKTGFSVFIRFLNASPNFSNRGLTF